MPFTKRIGPIAASADATWGTWWLGLWRWRLIVRAPWSLPYFSERYGFISTLRLPFGWRVQSRLVKQI